MLKHWQDWHLLVKKYSTHGLTKSSDKLVALAGIARRFGESTGDEYLAGLWRKSLVIDLCWSAWPYPVPNSPTLPRAGTIFPSWPWTAIDGEVRFIWMPSESKPKVFYVEIEHVNVVPDGPDCYGNIKEANLVIKSLFMVRARKRFHSTVIRGRPAPGELGGTVQHM